MDGFGDAFWAAVPGAVLLFFYGLLFALAEIEIEGPDGWAEKLPTWYRVTPWYARLFGRFMAGKPLTGYHAVMIPLTLVSFHLGFAFGQPWSLVLEARVLARYVLWTVVWDILWFLLNPVFGWRRFRPGQVWWLGRLWITRFPIEYWSALISSGVLATIACALAREAWVAIDHLAFIVVQVVLTVAAALLAPAYARWYHHMRRPDSDERHLAIRREGEG